MRVFPTNAPQNETDPKNTAKFHCTFKPNQKSIIMIFYGFDFLRCVFDDFLMDFGFFVLKIMVF